MNEVFKLLGSIVIKNEEANTAIDETTQKAKDLGDELDNAGTSADTMSGKIDANSKFGTAAVFMGNMLTTLATEAGKLVTNLAKAGIGLASDMEQNIGGVETLFGGASETVFKNADNAYKTAGMSANKYMETVTAFAAALMQSVETEEEAAKIADMAIIDMSDNANKMGTDMASIQNAYQGFAKQNFTMLDNLKLGYGGTKEEMERLLADAEKLSGQDYDISSLSDIFSAIHDIQTEMGIAGTTAEEASTTLSGSAASAKAAWDNFLSNTMVTVIPKITELTNRIMTWAEQNPETVQKFADAIKGFASISLDAVTGALMWMLENGEEIGAVIMGIATALTVGAIAAHPYATAIAAVAAGLAWLTSEEGKQKRSYDHFFDGHDQAALDALQRWVEAKRALKEADDTYQMNVSDEEYDALVDAADAAAQKVNELDEALIGLYNEWRSGQENGLEYLDVPMKAADDAESSLQTEVDGMNIESLVKMVADTSGLYAAVNATNLTAYVNLQPTGTLSSATQVDGSHASGLDDVPFDGYIARLHKGEAVLNSTNAEAWRSGGMGSTDRLEAMMSQLLTLTQQMVSNTAGGKQGVLDSGVLVGQLAPALDTQLGTISSRKGRRN